MKIKSFEFNMFPENTYVVWDDTSEAAIIDPGCYYKEEKAALRDFITDEHLIVKHLLNTHLHPDHVFGNHFVEQTFGVKAECHEAELRWVDEAKKLSRAWNIPLEDPIEAPTHFLYDGDVVRFGHTELKVIHVPGHSPGSIVFYCAEEHCMFAGDVLFQGSIGRTDLAGGNFDMLYSSICSRLFILPDDTLVYTGHGAPTTIGAEKKENPFFKR